PSMWGSVQGGIQFMIYEPAKSRLQAYRGCEQLSPPDIVLATTVAKSTAMIIISPITVLTVRMRDAGLRSHNYDDLWTAVKRYATFSLLINLSSAIHALHDNIASFRFQCGG
ncbi:hypothetical protein FOZ63_017070, partial [Perkinsus olseni]